MLDRYLVKEIDEIWNENNKLNIWLDVEILVLEAWNKLKIVPTKELDLIKKNAKVDRKLMLEIEKQTKHDVVAFTRMLSENLGEEKKWIHLGLTSTDVVDTAQNKMIKMSNEIVQQELNNLSKILKDKALQYKDTLTMGRSHGIYGEPTSLGLKFLLWFEEIKRQIERFEIARKQTEVAKISGSMGNHAHLELEIENYVADKMNLSIDPISTQVTQRDRHAFLISVFSIIASTMEKIATEIRLFQRSEVQEILEGFATNQKGSSSMPHKKNPISSENITGMSRYIRSFVNMTLENNVLWHERDISHSSNERIVFPDIYSSMVYSLRRLIDVIKNLVVNVEAINKHINEQNNVFFSQRVLTYLIIESKVSREKAYDLIQKHSFTSLKDNVDFKTVLINNNIYEFITEPELEKLFDIKYFVRNVDKIFKRVF
ncbi:adenylosuccinate lyase [Spiroplasma endosymbiont of Crioceris asparagi]|uniref:adenylosuccinate lyase n=1 Tax=Spiroplasma endosymbiont of Crioceris asparagi TaxID=3066286 RepID=UPI0030D28175